jgi:Collagen triple helix repeat (20 copies)
MNKLMLLPIVVIALSQSACDRPTVVNVPPPAAAVPGPAGPQGETGMQGAQGNDGNQGAAGKPGDPTTVIVNPPEGASTATPAPATTPTN